MAIDTRQKRFSMMNFGGMPIIQPLWGIEIGFTPAHRPFAPSYLHTLGLYTGIALSAAIAVITPSRRIFAISAENRTFVIGEENRTFVIDGDN